jgi:hypothetical protein
MELMTSRPPQTASVPPIYVAGYRNMPKIFISYRRSETAYVATLLSEKLIEEFGTNSVFFDIDNIPLGVDFRRHIDSAVARCDVLIALIGDDWLTCELEDGTRRLENPSDFVRIEIEAALNRKIPVIPILTANSRMPNADELPQSLSELAFRNASELRAGPDCRAHIERLITGLNTLFKKIDTARKQAADGRSTETRSTKGRSTETRSEQSGGQSTYPRSTERKSGIVPRPPLPLIPQSVEPKREARRARRPFVRRVLLLYRTKTILARLFQLAFFAAFALWALVTLSILGNANLRKDGLILIMFTSGLMLCPVFLFAWIPAVLLDEQ